MSESGHSKKGMLDLYQSQSLLSQKVSFSSSSCLGSKEFCAKVGETKASIKEIAKGKRLFIKSIQCKSFGSEACQKSS